MSRRGWAAIAVLAFWVVGMGFLVRRELFRPDTELFTEMGLRMTPTTMFYAVMRDGSHIGFASSTVDTTESAITLVDYLVADVPVAGGRRRMSSRTAIELSRGMRLRSYLIESAGPSGSMLASGTVEGDSVITAVLRRENSTSADTQRVALPGPVLMPVLLPFAVALSSEPEIDREYDVPVFDPRRLIARTAALRVAAETLFVIDDSATFDPVEGRWLGALPIGTRALQIESDDSTGFSGWIDEQGRLVRGSRAGGLQLVRRPYALAYLNWQIANDGGTRIARDPNDRILEISALAANVRPDPPRDSITLVLTGVDLGAFDLASNRQRLRGDTLRVTAQGTHVLDARYRLGQFTRNMSRAEQERWSRWLRNEAMVETMDPDIRRLAQRLRSGSNDPRVVAERIHRWVTDSLTKTRTSTLSGARAVLERGTGDANDHTQLLVALARAASIPARAAAGLVHINGKFYYHAWPEIYLGDWVAIDPTHDRFPADASLVRFVVGGLDRQSELVRLIGTLEIEVLEPR